MHTLSAGKNRAMTIFGHLTNSKNIQRTNHSTPRPMEKMQNANTIIRQPRAAIENKNAQVINKHQSHHSSWLDDFTDESNTWLNAIRTEEMGDTTHAYELYIQDAQMQFATGALLHAGLSYFCAAECIDKLGESEKAETLYARAAELYLANFKRCIKYSIAEAIWALQRAHYCFIRAKDKDNTIKAKDLLDFITSKTLSFNNNVEDHHFPLDAIQDSLKNDGNNNSINRANRCDLHLEDSDDERGLMINHQKDLENKSWKKK
jgi:hypothetical protein